MTCWGLWDILRLHLLEPTEDSEISSDCIYYDLLRIQGYHQTTYAITHWRFLEIVRLHLPHLAEDSRISSDCIYYNWLWIVACRQTTYTTTCWGLWDDVRLHLLSLTEDSGISSDHMYYNFYKRYDGRNLMTSPILLSAFSSLSCMAYILGRMWLHYF